MNSDNSGNTNLKSFGNSFVESADVYLDELSHLSLTTSNRQDFYRQLIDRLRSILNADDAAVWVGGPNQKCLAALRSTKDVQSKMTYELTDRSFNEALKLRSTKVLSDSGNSIFSIPINVENEEQKVITLIFLSSLDSQLAKVYCDLGDAISDIALSFEHRLAVGNLDKKFAKLGSFVQLLRNSSQSLDLRKVGFHLTNDCRAFLEADRVWLFSADGRVKLVACSGVDDVNPRSRSFRMLKRVVRKSAKRREPCAYVPRESITENELRPLADYVQAESLDGIYLQMLQRTESQNVDGVLVVEYFQPHDSMSVVSGLNSIVPCVESAVSNSIKFDRLPFRNVLQSFRWLIEKFRLNALPKTLLLIAAVAGFLAAIFMVEKDFEIEVNGALRPAVQRHVFAPVDATVASINVDYGDVVSKNESIVTLESNDFELKINGLQNELSAARKKLEANQILHTQASNDGKDSLYLGQLTAEIEQNRFDIGAINEKIDWYLKRADDLEITSAISGTIVSRDVRMSLLKRPVKAGNQLLTIADTNSQWQIEFEIPDREFGYLLDAKRNDDIQDWNVKYRFQSDLDATHESQIARADENNSYDQNGNAFVKAYAPIEGTGFRVGQTVIGKVYCGRKSLFFVWTRDVRDFLRSNFFWM